MRLHPLGPDFPDALVDELLEGDVVFLCGAGVSLPQLPSFEGLVERVYERLGLERTRAENLAFDQKKFEEVLGALSRRLARVEDLFDATRAELTLPAESTTAHHDVLVRISRDREGRPSIVTTNFDTLFERSIARNAGVDAAALASTAGQEIPAPGSSRFHGVVHLHGRLEDNELGLAKTDLVLTSAQYGEAYLRAGWAARFLFDLARCRTLVLVGYTASDAPVRYILNVLEGDRERFVDLRTVYALASSNGNAEAAAAPWETLAVRPLLFERPHEDSGQDQYEPLWTSLDRLAGLLESPDEWRRSTIERVVAQPVADAPESDVADVNWCLRGRADFLEAFVAVCVDSEWFKVLEPVFSDIGQTALPWAMARWLSADWEDPDRWAAAEQFYKRRTDSAAEFLWRELDRSPPASSVFGKAWRLMAQTATDRMVVNSGRDFLLRRRVAAGTVTETDLRSIVSAYAPRLELRRISLPQNQNPKPERLSDIASFSLEAERQNVLRDVITPLAAMPDRIGRLLAMASEQLISSLSTAVDIEMISEDLDLTDWGVPSVTAHGQNAYRAGFVPLVELIASLLPLAVEADPDHVRRLAATWRATRRQLATRLWFHALSLPKLYEASEAILGLLSCSSELFWSLNPESVHLIRARAGEADAAVISQLIVRVLTEGGRSRIAPSSDSDEEDWQDAARDRDVWLRLSALAEVIDLSEEAESTLNNLRESHRHLDRSIEEQDLFRGWSYGIRAVRGNPAPLAAAEPSERLDIADQQEQSRDIDERSGWSEYCRQDLAGALSALRERPLDQAVVARWRDWLFAIPRSADNAACNEVRAVEEAISLLNRADTEFLTSLVHPLTRAYESAIALDVAVPEEWFDRLWEAAAAESTPANQSERDLYEIAINSAGGDLAEILLNRLNSQLGEFGSADAQDVSRLNVMIGADTFAGLMACAVCARHLAFLFGVAETAARERLLPRISGHDDNALRLRAIVVENNSFPSDTARTLSDIILRGVSESRATNVAAANTASHLVRAAVGAVQQTPTDWGISVPQARDAIRAASPAVREGALRILESWIEESDVADRGEQWRTVYWPVFSAIWPKDRSFLSNDVSELMFNLACATGDAFPNAVESLIHYIRPLEGDWLSLHKLDSDDFHLARNFPDATVRLLWSICQPPCKGRSPEMGHALDRVILADSSFSADRRVHKLRLRVDAF
ncbi:SIR2 family protein [Brucella pseudogrignonensis]|uniref:SIR2 family NAD-dependent protein deacylase n=1 Tax=Brucella pseudogrignonensis TaxID=419475 RepID=UPI00190CC172|nr:SIR2 family protein [Brucella pseudogrignonensis]MBK0022872.1 SIR2 family protein [Ochrobactrum sp. S45]MBK0044887.1 SIR2 family protein [Ochrobactrum sp. S46]UKK95363.1 SIR2 family protein [Brucella pseudogrignonensis]